MSEQFAYLAYTDTNTVENTIETPELSDLLSRLYVVKKNRLLSNVSGFFKAGSPNRSHFFMDFRYSDYAKYQKGLSYMTPIYGVKGLVPKITRNINYVEVFYGIEDDMNGEGFNNKIHGAGYITADETVTLTPTEIEAALERQVDADFSIDPKDIESVAKVLEKLWEAQEVNPSTRFIILMDNAEADSMELLRKLYLLIPHRLRLQTGYETNITQADLNLIRDNNGLPIYVLTANKSDYNITPESYSFPVVTYDMTQPEAYTYDPERLAVITELANSLDRKTVTKLSYVERKVIEANGDTVSSFKYYREVLKEMGNDHLFWWKNKELGSLKDLTAALNDQDELMKNPDLLDEGLLTFFKQMVPDSTYAQDIIDLIEDESNPDRDAMLETLGSKLQLTNEITAVKNLIDKLNAEKAQALADQEAAERAQKAKELTEQKNSYENQIDSQKKSYESQISDQKKSYETQIDDQKKSFESQISTQKESYEKKLKDKEDVLTSTKEQLAQKSDMFDKMCSTNKANVEKVQSLQQTVDQKDSEIETLKNRIHSGGTANVEALQDDLEKTQKKLRHREDDLAETEGKKKLFTVLTSIFGVLTVAGIACAVIFFLKAGKVAGLQQQVESLSSEKAGLVEQITEAMDGNASTVADYEARMSEKQSELDAAAAALSAAESERDALIAAAQTEAPVETELPAETEGASGEVVVTDNNGVPGITVDGVEQPIL